MQPKIIQICTGQYSFFNDEIKQVLNSFNVVGLDDDGRVYVFVNKDKNWIPIENYGAKQQNNYDIYTNRYVKK